MDLKRTLRSPTFALTLIVGGLLSLLLGLILGLVGGSAAVWALILVLAGVVDIGVGVAALWQQSRISRAELGRTASETGAATTARHTL